jgi:hypothetical protein
VGSPSAVQFLPYRQRLKLMFYLASLFFLIGLYGLTHVGAAYFLQEWIIRSTCGSATHFDACASANLSYSLLLGLAISATLVVVAPFIANVLLVQMRRRSTYALYEMQRTDARPPILFLRAFQDDQVALREPNLTLFGRMIDFGRPHVNLDQLLLELATPYGPLVALGNPSDALPPYGAARGYFDAKNWQEAVEQLAKESAAIILCLDDTEGVRWEVAHLAEQNLLTKTLVLIHPKDSDAAANGIMVGRLANRLSESFPGKSSEELTALVGRGTGQQPVIGLLFNNDGTPAVARSSTFSRLAFTLAIRWFLRSKLGIEPSVAKSPSGLSNSAKVAVVWLIVGWLTQLGMGRLFVHMQWDWFAYHRAPMLSGWIAGTVLVVGLGAGLALKQERSARDTAFAIYWLGSSLLVGWLFWGIVSIEGIASDQMGLLAGAVFVLLNLLIWAFAWPNRQENEEGLAVDFAPAASSPFDRWKPPRSWPLYLLATAGFVAIACYVGTLLNKEYRSFSALVWPAVLGVAALFQALLTWSVWNSRWSWAHCISVAITCFFALMAYYSLSLDYILSAGFNTVDLVLMLDSIGRFFGPMAVLALSSAAVLRYQIYRMDRHRSSWIILISGIVCLETASLVLCQSVIEYRVELLDFTSPVFDVLLYFVPGLSAACLCDGVWLITMAHRRAAQNRKQSLQRAIP